MYTLDKNQYELLSIISYEEACKGSSNFWQRRLSFQKTTEEKEEQNGKRNKTKPRKKRNKVENDEYDSEDDEREETDGEEDENKVTRGKNKKTKGKKSFNDESSDLNSSRFVSAFATFWTNQKSLARSCFPKLFLAACLFYFLVGSFDCLCFGTDESSLTLGLSGEICHFQIVEEQSRGWVQNTFSFSFAKTKENAKLPFEPLVCFCSTLFLFYSVDNALKRFKCQNHWI